jgi:WD40 repeat protein
MPSFDCAFVDPAEDQLVRTMVEAVQTANKRCRVGKLMPDEAAYRRFVRQEIGTTEGVRQWTGQITSTDQPLSGDRATLLGVAWWTDPLGRKHVRVAGRRQEGFSQHARNLFAPYEASRPPLWLVHPERLLLRTLPGGRPELLALCRCGALGPPQGLGWMGDGCGPCHDHQEEFGSPLARPGLVLELGVHDAGVCGVGWSESGRTVITAADDGTVRFWDPVAGTLRKEQKKPVQDGFPAAFTCNGWHAVLASYYLPCQCWHAEDGEQATDLPLPEQGYDFLALAPDGETLAGGNFRQVEVWDVPRRKVAEQRWSLDLEPSCLTFGPDSRRLAIGGRQGFWMVVDAQAVHVLSPEANTARHAAGRAVQAIAFAPDDQTLVVGMARGVSPLPLAGDPASPGMLACFDWADNLVATLHDGEGVPRALAFSGDGKTLAAGFTDRAVRIWAMPEGRPLGSLEWHLGSVQALAFSPDGEWLVSGGADGHVRLWPWKRLLTPG